MRRKYDFQARRYVALPDTPILIPGRRFNDVGKTTTTTIPGTNFSIPELTSDPVSPATGDAWILKTTSGGAGGGKLKYLIGLATPITSKGTATTTYQFCYRTLAGVTIRVTMA